MSRVILRNAAECPACHQTIESKYDHDFVTCRCGAISVDGGRSYIRRVSHPGVIPIEKSEYGSHDVHVQPDFERVIRFDSLANQVDSGLDVYTPKGEDES